MLVTKTHQGLVWFQFSALLALKEVWHGIFTRSGGVSSDPFSSLNVGGGNGDLAENVRVNRQRIADILGAPKIHTIHQTHGTNIVRLDRIENTTYPVSLSGDAMISGTEGLFLMIQVADCQAILLADPNRKVVANIHSGWRGSVGNIAGKTARRLIDQYGCRPEHIIAAVGPSLGPCCAEFKHYHHEIPRQFWSYKDGRDHFNFWAISHDQLMAAGLMDKNIHLSQICTRCNPHLLFSYRGQGKTGRFAAVIGLTRPSIH